MRLRVRAGEHVWGLGSEVRGYTALWPRTPFNAQTYTNPPPFPCTGRGSTAGGERCVVRWWVTPSQRHKGERRGVGEEGGEGL